MVTIPIRICRRYPKASTITILTLLLVTIVKGPYQLCKIRAPNYYITNQRTNTNNLIQNNNKTPLDFAIIGFPRCATTTFMHYLNTEHIWTPREEKCRTRRNNDNNDGGDLSQYLATHAPRGTSTKRGIKCSRAALSVTTLLWYRDYFSETRLMIGVRHPVTWFESYYNFVAARR
eukprot:CAMPEP_0172501556 /NCGR_PEP_ID=MMETSP1066-20121228/150883_1 /TAXON_ID=671091 /ORGANISM="Coscinodiscus wailesii, Strain CCMP2513" /LENGTH=174 /DNA_ID=CAMNT_0013276389 /DNA_START=26 /DNA_END=547 /DNA_ORIENTATION=-